MTDQLSSQGLNVTAISLFLTFVVFTLFITVRAARRSKTASEFYAAGNTISGFMNGVAISGDFMSAATFTITFTMREAPSRIAR